jgi:SagB-type dehydrogenase family enzyme
MNTGIFQGIILALAVLFFCPGLCAAEALQTIPLPPPQTDGGRPLMQVLKERSSSRAFGSKTLSRHELSNLLWAAFGVNRSDSGKRTAPSAKNQQEIDIYVATADGLYLYDVPAHTLKQILAADIRAETGLQPYVKEAAVNLVYVADMSRMGDMKDEDKVFYSAADAGFIGQNVYLYCTSEGLGTVVRGAIDRPALSKVMGLRPDQKVILAQSVGYPK